jgi:glutathione S-transferase
MRSAAPAGGLHPEITLPHGDAWELYHNSFSLCSKKLRVCLAELALPYRSHPIELIETGAYENVSRRFLAVNPAGTVPVLVHEGHPVYESHDQIVYAAERAGERGEELLPADPEGEALVEHWTDCASLVGNALGGSERRAGHCVPGLTFPIFATMVRSIPYREIARGLLTHPNKERPLFFALLKLRTVHGLPGLRPLMAVLRRSRDHMGTHLDALGRLLDGHGGPWIAGSRFTLADVSWVVILDRLAEADWDAFFWGEGRRPAVAAYWERLRARPSWASGIEAARCPATRRGIAELKAAKAADARLREALEGGQEADPGVGPACRRAPADHEASGSA